jgi:hypothetical protein
VVAILLFIVFVNTVAEAAADQRVRPFSCTMSGRYIDCG